MRMCPGQRCLAVGGTQVIAPRLGMDTDRVWSQKISIHWDTVSLTDNREDIGSGRVTKPLA